MIVAFSEIFLTNPSSRKVCRKVGYSIEVMQTVTGWAGGIERRKGGVPTPGYFQLDPKGFVVPVYLQVFR